MWDDLEDHTKANLILGTSVVGMITLDLALSEDWFPPRIGD